MPIRLLPFGRWLSESIDKDISSRFFSLDSKVIDNMEKSDRHFSTETRTAKLFGCCSCWMKHGKRHIWNISLYLDIKKKGKDRGKWHYINTSMYPQKSTRSRTCSTSSTSESSTLFTRDSFVGTCRHSSFCRWLSNSIDKNLYQKWSVRKVKRDPPILDFNR